MANRSAWDGFLIVDIQDWIALFMLYSHVHLPFLGAIALDQQALF